MPPGEQDLRGRPSIGVTEAGDVSSAASVMGVLRSALAYWFFNIICLLGISMGGGARFCKVHGGGGRGSI